MEDLEILKNNWEKENQLLVFSKEEIFEMMRRKSMSISRTLLWIGCLEVVLWILFFYIDSNSLTSFLDWKLFFRSVLFLFFIFIIIYSYLKINNESDARSLMKQILNLRKMILIYIILMIISIILFNIIDAKESAYDVLRGYVEGYNDASSNKTLSISDINPSAGYIAFSIIFIISISILLSIYRAVYGSLLQKLKENYKELSKIETNN